MYERTCEYDSNICIILYGKGFTVHVITSDVIIVADTDSECQICDW
jgi:hypothetical protein